MMKTLRVSKAIAFLLALLLVFFLSVIFHVHNLVINFKPVSGWMGNVVLHIKKEILFLFIFLLGRYLPMIIVPMPESQLLIIIPTMLVHSI